MGKLVANVSIIPPPLWGLVVAFEEEAGEGAVSAASAPVRAEPRQETTSSIREWWSRWDRVAKSFSICDLPERHQR